MWNSRHFTLMTRVDLPYAAVRIHIDDQVALTGLQGHPGQDTDHTIIIAASVALRVVKYATNVRAVHIQAVQALGHRPLAVCAARFGWRARQDGESEAKRDDRFYHEARTERRAMLTDRSRLGSSIGYSFINRESPDDHLRSPVA